MGIYVIYIIDYIGNSSWNNSITFENKKKTYVAYYDYKGLILVGNQKEIEEYYGRGGFDPINNKYGYNYEVLSTTYYDENGNIL